MKDSKKQKITKQHISEQQRIKEAEERQNLIFKADSFLPSIGTDKYLDEKLEKIELRSGKVISLREVTDFLTQSPQDYYVMFIPEFYKQIFRLNGWKGDITQRPHVVAVWTLELIYSRFPKSILPAIQILNPFTDFGIRMFKHFQFLNADGKIMLAGFINDAIKLMSACDTWYEFRLKYGKQYNLPVQLKML